MKKFLDGIGLNEYDRLMKNYIGEKDSVLEGRIDTIVESLSTILDNINGEVVQSGK